jgi:hypothetical protein
MPRAALLALLTALAAAPQALAQQSDEEVARNLEDPIYHQISLPLQSNFDCCYGAAHGSRYTLNIQPVIPIDLGDNSDIIARSIIPILYEHDNTPGQGSHAGFGDIMESFFFSPRNASPLVWGIGPAIQLPTGDSQLGTGKWEAGPTFAIGERSGPINVIMVVYQLWSFAGDRSRSAVSKMRLQPSLAYTFKDSTTLKVGVDADYDWAHRQWTAPINAGVSRVVAVQGHRIQFAIAGKLYAASPNGTEAGLRLTATWVFAK